MKNDDTLHRWGIIYREALKKFFQIDGPHRAGAFAYFAFFALFPLIILIVSLASRIIDHAKASLQVIDLLERFVPLNNKMQLHIFDTIGGVAKSHGPAGVAAFVILIWVSLQFLTVIISATNHAGGMKDPKWWRVPLKSLGLLVILIVLAICGIISLVRKTIHWLVPAVQTVPSWVHSLAGFFGPLGVLFFSLALFYKLAPSRSVRGAHVWAGAITATTLLRTGEWIFVYYLHHFSKLNAIYGAFGGIMALLLWIYLSGCIFIFGACLSASQAEIA